MKSIKNSYILILPLLVILIILLTFSSNINNNQNCTIFTVSNENNTIYANNEDSHFKNLIVGFIPPSESEYGSVKFGYVIDGVQTFEGAVNDSGLIWDINSVPKTKMNAHPEKTFSHARDNYFSLLTKKVSTVEEAIQIAGDFDFGDSMTWQIHIADASGDAVVIGPGQDGEIAYTRKGNSKRFLVSTNFSLADPKNENCWRYDTAMKMLSDKGDSEYTIEYISEIIEAVHLRTLTSFTLYSNIVDLTNKKIYLYYMSQYNERVELDIDEELAKGYKVMEMRNLFSAETREAGDKDYDRFAFRFTAVKIIVIFLGIVLITSVVVLIVVITKKIRKKKTKSLKE